MNKSEITEDVIACLVSQQAAWLATERVEAVHVDGWDNSSFRVGTGFVARMPTADGYMPAVDKEHRWLPVLAPHLPVAIPEPVLRGEPGCGFPWPWSLYRWLPGETALANRIADPLQFARDTAEFLRDLQSVDTTDAPHAGAHSFGRGGPLEVYDEDVMSCLPYLPPDVEEEAVLQAWADAISSPHLGPPRWFHGDMAPSNILLDNGRLSAVIDFGTCGIGDPACDLVLAWTHLDDTAADAFRGALTVDDALWLRGRAWALWKALLTLRDPDPAASAARYGWRFSTAEIVRRAAQPM
jgi:aminoglycoside phosphotransferase (APT) family kinase protein